MPSLKSLTRRTFSKMRYASAAPFFQFRLHVGPELRTADLDPTNDGFEFVVGERDGKHILTLRDAQHEYIFNEAQ